MFKYIVEVSIISIFLAFNYCIADEIFKWVDKDGIEHYSNDPTQVPYGDWLSVTDKKPEDAQKIDKNTEGSDEIATISKGLPDDSKKQLNKFLEAEKKLQGIITAKNEELNNLKKQKDVSKEEMIKLENFILQAEDKLKIVKNEKNEFIKQNNLNNNI